MKLSDLIRKTISDKVARMKGTDLKAKSARAAMALGAGTVVERGLRAARNMILARILAPDQFGLMAIVLVAASVLEAFVELGVKQSVIQNKRGAEAEYLNVAWWFQVVRGLALFVIAFFLAPLVSSFYGNPELLGLLQLSFLAILFRGLVSPRAYVLEKEYRFGRVVLLIQGSGVLGTVTAVVLAFIIRNVWALAIGFVAEFAIMCVLSYVIAPFKPAFRIHRENLGELLKYARGMFGLSILTLIAFRTDVVVLGKVVAEGELGMYYLAVTLVQLPSMLFARVVNPILLPAFSEKQDDRDSLCRAILRVAKTAAVFGVPLVAFMVSCASGILLLAYGQDYVAVTIPFALLCLLILPETQNAVLGSAYFAVGRPYLHRRFVTLRAAIIVGLIYPAVLYFGLFGAAAVVVVGNFVALLMQVFWCRRIVDLKFGTYMRCYLAGLLLGLPVVVPVNLLRLSGIESPVVLFAVGLVGLFGAFAGGICVFRRIWSNRA